MRRSLLINSIAGALNSALVPIVALVLLAPTQYGRFSIVYLVFAFGLSLQLSFVGEAWARSRTARDTTERERKDFFGVLGWLCVLLYITAFIAGIFAFGENPGHWALGGLGVAAGVQRLGARYFGVYEQQFGRVLISDVLGILGFAITIPLALLVTDGLTAILLGWALGGLFSAVALAVPRLASPSIVRAWVVDRWRYIRVLFADSTLLDLGGIGTPLLLAGFLGQTNFGIYRGVSSVAVPVSLLMDPLRPSLAKAPPRLLFRGRLILLLAAVGAALGVGAYVVLVVILPILPFTVGTLNALTPFAFAAAIYVFFFLAGYPYYIAYRVHAQGREILLGRILQTIFAIVLPVVGFLWDGLNGAIWGFTGTAVVSTVVSVGILFTTVRREKSASTS